MSTSKNLTEFINNIQTFKTPEDYYFTLDVLEIFISKISSTKEGTNKIREANEG